MALPQRAHLPRSTSQLTTGTFCQAEMGARQAGQRERGTIRLKRLRGRRFAAASP
jgi:hypothetical protein